jgi:hypothetical protein
LRVSNIGGGIRTDEHKESQHEPFLLIDKNKDNIFRHIDKSGLQFGGGSFDERYK